MSLNNIKLLQINLHHSRAAATNLLAVMLRMGVDVALIQEPWQWGGVVRGLNIPGFDILASTSKNKVRTCIMIKKTLNYLYLSNLSSADLSVVRLEVGNGEGEGAMLLASAYLPYDAPTPPPTEELKTVVRYGESNRLELLIGADANAHHICWGSSDINKRGEYLIEYISQTSLHVVNVGNEPTFANKNRKEVLDITLVTEKSLNKIVDWEVSKEISMSDHMYITFKISLENASPSAAIATYRNARHTDWTKFERILNGQCRGAVPLNTSAEVDKEVTNLQNLITQAYEKTCPILVRKDMRSPIWWNNKLSKMRKDLLKISNRAKKTLSETDAEAAKNAKRNFKHELRQSKRDCWRNHCSHIKSASETSRLTKAFSKNPDAQLGTLKKDDGTYTETKSESLITLMRTHFPGCVINESDSQTVTNRALDYNNVQHNDCNEEQFITPTRVAWAISSFAPYKSPGPDNIQPILLQKMGTAATTRLSDIFRACIRLSFVPLAWRTSKVVFLPKPGKETYNTPKAFRPISLMSFILKTLERLCDRYIRDTCLKRTPLHNLQHAYMAGRSVESALHCVLTKIEKSMESKEYALGVFLDIEGAFDRVSYDVIRNACTRFRIDANISNWILNMLLNRHIRVESNDITHYASVNQGCPQGGVLSPLLWSLVVDSLLETLNATGYFTVGYADDIVIIIRGKHLQTVAEVAQQALCSMEQWCTKNGLSVNPTKTGLVLFTNKRDYSLPRPLRLFGGLIELQSHTKYLGVTLDRKLTFGVHIENKCSAALRALWQCRRSFGATWGLSPKVTRWIYTAMIRPALCYASIAWWHRAKLTTVKQQLTRVQRLACICITGAIRSSPTNALEILLGLLPIDIYVESEALLAAHRLSDATTWKGQAFGHACILTSSNLLPVEANMRSDHAAKTYHFDNMFNTKIPNREDWDSGSVILNGICIFTDGAKSGHLLGSGVYSSELNLSITTPLGEQITIFQAEVHAILQAAQMLLENKTCNVSINILTNSQAAINTLKSHCRSSLLVNDCCAALNQLSANNSVNLLWVPAHSGIEGNIAADELAKAGAQMVLYGPRPALGVTTKCRSATVRCNAFSAQASLWSEAMTGAHMRTFIGGPSAKLTRKILDYSRNKIGTYTNILTGHYLNKHMHRMGVAASPLCRFCSSDGETVMHVVCNCPALNTERALAFGRDTLMTIDLDKYKLDEILHFVEYLTTST